MKLDLIHLQEDELSGRTSELLGDNSQNVLGLLVQYSRSSGTSTVFTNEKTAC